MLTRRQFAQVTGLAAIHTALSKPFQAENLPAPDITLEIAPYLLEASPKHRIQTTAYNGQIPGPLLRMRQGKPITIQVSNQTPEPDVVHWHGLFLPPDVDGAMEEGTPMIAPGSTTRITFTPDPAGFRWFHTHTFAGKDLHKGQFNGQHGFLLIEPPNNPGRYDRELFLGLHDWNAAMMGSDDGSMTPSYEFSTINGKMLGSGEPLRVKQGERVLFHVLNSSATDVHWLALPGHAFQILALDGNPVPTPRSVDTLRLAPAERISAIVEMTTPGIWVLGETHRHIREGGMGIVVEYAEASGEPKWVQPANPTWDYAQFATPGLPAPTQAEPINLTFDSRFEGHGSPERWTINGQSYPKTPQPILKSGQRYRLVMQNKSTDDHPVHLHRHTFEVRRVGTGPEQSGLRKDTLLIPAKSTSEIEFTANHPGNTLFHCHQQDHMDRGFMMLFRYA